MLTAWRRYLGDPVASWRTGSPHSQVATLVVLLCGVGLCFVVSAIQYSLMPMTTYFLWLLLGMLLLRFRPLVVLCAVSSAAAVGAVLLDPPMTVPRIVACVSLGIAVALILFASSRQQSGLPGAMGEAMLADLRDRLHSQSAMPALPEPWASQSVLVAANSVGYGGDFMIAYLSDDERRLEVILVDVCGKGVQAASRALQFNGALGGLIGALSPDGLFNAANRFLLRNSSDETFATAVHVLVDLPTGYYELTNAGHPPALLWSTSERAWVADRAQGTALGILPAPELRTTSGTLRAGDALMFYTDGVVESRSTDLDEGVAWLRCEGAKAVDRGFDGAAARIIAKVDRDDDDRAVVILQHGDLTPALATEDAQPSERERGVAEVTRLS
jgi:hypothetical protein